MLKRLGLLPVSKLGNNTKISICNSDIIFRPYYNCFYQSDEKLVEMVQKSDYNLVKPSSADYNFSSPYLSAGQWGQVSLSLVYVVIMFSNSPWCRQGSWTWLSSRSHWKMDSLLKLGQMILSLIPTPSILRLERTGQVY